MFKKWYGDLLGIGASVLCLIHCLIPLMVVTSGSLAHELTHNVWVDVLFLSLSGLAVWFVSKTHARKEIKAMLWISYILLVPSIALHDVVFFQVVSYLAALGLISTHFWNLLLHFRRASVRVA